jgi:hypothetical protein
MPDVLESQSTQETAVPSTPSTQDTNRQALYEQYYGTAGEAPPAETTAPPTEVVAQTPQVEAPVVPPAATLPPEVLQLMQAMQAELADVKSRLPQPVAQPAGPTPEANWVQLLREGKTDEAISEMAALVATKNYDALIQQTMAQTREVMRAEADIERFTTDLRSQNPELVPMESLIASEAQNRMAVARQQGLIKTTDDAIRIYKASVTEAVTSARKLYLTIRGDGKQEAQVRQREVLSSRPVSPQQVDTNRPQVTGEPQEPPTESPTEYIERRRAIDNWKKGLAPKPNFL